MKYIDQALVGPKRLLPDVRVSPPLLEAKRPSRLIDGDESGPVFASYLGRICASLRREEKHLKAAPPACSPATPKLR